MNVKLTKHENRKYEAVTLYLSGNAYFNCQFLNCTLIFSNAPLALNGCHFQNCNWRIEYDVLWGAPQTLETLRKLVDTLSSGVKKDFSSDVH